MKNKLILIDGNAIIHRAYHAMPPLTTSSGEPIGAVQGFINILLKIIQDFNPTHIAVCWDRKEPTFRQIEYVPYQAHRPEADSELISQFEKVRRATDAFGIPSYDKKGFEADDLIGTLASLATKDTKIRRYEDTGKKKSNISISQYPSIDTVIIVTGDKDQLQLVNEKVKVFMPIKGLASGLLMGEMEVLEKMGVKPEQVIDLKAFMGDSSDNYPGVFGIGPKTAIKLLEEFGSYPEVYKHLDELPENLVKKLKDGKDGGDISYKLAKIVTDMDMDVDFDEFDDWQVDSSEVLALFDEFGFRTLTKRVQQVGRELRHKKVSEDQMKLL
jgi:DNA polymerase I